MRNFRNQVGYDFVIVLWYLILVNFNMTISCEIGFGYRIVEKVIRDGIILMIMLFMLFYFVGDVFFLQILNFYFISFKKDRMQVLYIIWVFVKNVIEDWSNIIIRFGVLMKGSSLDVFKIRVGYG